MRQIFAVLILCASPAVAEDWIPLDGPGIQAALTGRVLDYDPAWQDFRASGRTLYFAGHDSWGSWDVRENRYCSQWPPNSRWECYDVDMSADGRAIRFRGDFDDVTVGNFRE